MNLQKNWAILFVTTFFPGCWTLDTHFQLKVCRSVKFQSEPTEAARKIPQRRGCPSQAAMVSGCPDYRFAEHFASVWIRLEHMCYS